MRQVLAAHFVRDCPHIVEIGGHLKPITGFLTHAPLSVLSVDPKTAAPRSRDTRRPALPGSPCRRASSRRSPTSYAPRSYGLVLLGYSLKPFGGREPLGELLFGLIDNARIVVLDYPPALDRAASQVPVDRQPPDIVTILCSFDFDLDDAAIAGSPYAHAALLRVEARR